MRNTFSDLCSSVETYINRKSSHNFLTSADHEHDQLYTDRRCLANNIGSPRDRGSHGQFRHGHGLSRNNNRRQCKKKCFVCNREGCWSTKYTQEERRKAKSQFLTNCEFTGEDPGNFA